MIFVEHTPFLGKRHTSVMEALKAPFFSEDSTLVQIQSFSRMLRYQTSLEGFQFQSNVANVGPNRNLCLLKFEFLLPKGAKKFWSCPNDEEHFWLVTWKLTNSSYPLLWSNGKIASVWWADHLNMHLYELHGKILDSWLSYGRIINFFFVRW